MRTEPDYRFRIWDPECEEYDKVSFHSFEALIDWTASQKRTDNGNGELDVKGVHLGQRAIEQCTMAKDIRGALIWEGDIVREVWVRFVDNDIIGGPLVETVGSVGTVVYTTGADCSIAAAFVVRFEAAPNGAVATGSLGVARWTDGTHRWWEVVGNIHENAALLSQP